MGTKNDNPKEIQDYIQSQLAAFRKQKNITQKDVAYQVNVSAKTISDIENNRRGISLKTLIRICNVLEIDIRNIFNINKKNDKKTT